MRAAVRLLDAVPAGVAARFGSGGAAARLARPLVNALVGCERVVATVRSGPGMGLALELDPRREKYYWSGAYETAVQRAFAQMLRPGATFWDVGAHIGFLTLLASRLVGASGSVHAFEPVPTNARRLSANVVRNEALNVTVHEVALGAQQGRGALVAHTASSMWRVAAGGDDGTVQCTTLDDLARRLGPPDVVKVDAEGAELDVLRGGCALLRAQAPVLLVELAAGRNVADLHDALPGYDAVPLDLANWLLTRTRA